MTPPETEESKFSVIPLNEFLTQPEEQLPWLVDGLLPTSGFSILAGSPKSGKSTLARYLALCVARGKPFLGQASLTGKVVYLALEERAYEVKNHFKAMGAEHESNILLFVGAAPQAPGAELTLLLTARKPVLVIIDTLQRFARFGEINSYSDVSSRLEPLLTLSRLSGSHILCLHHMGKSNERSGPERMLGSTALHGSVDTLMMLNRRGAQRSISTDQRAGNNLPETNLKFDADTRTFDLGDPLSSTAQRDLRSAILAHIESAGGAVEKDAIQGILKVNRATAYEAVDQLVQAGQLFQSGGGKKGSPYLISTCEINSVPSFPT